MSSIPKDNFLWLPQPSSLEHQPKALSPVLLLPAAANTCRDKKEPWAWHRAQMAGRGKTTMNLSSEDATVKKPGLRTLKNGMDKQSSWRSKQQKGGATNTHVHRSMKIFTTFSRLPQHRYHRTLLIQQNALYPAVSGLHRLRLTMRYQIPYNLCGLRRPSLSRIRHTIR